MASVLLRGTQRGTDAQREGGRDWRHVAQSNAKECGQEPPRASNNLMSDFRAQNSERIHFCCSKPPDLQ